MNRRASTSGDRLPLLITIGVFVVMLACLPLALMLDDNIDEDRPMYQDLLRMQNYQAVHIASDGLPVEASVSDGETVEVGAKTFVASAGVTIVVRVTDSNSFCVAASNDLGAKAERCTDAEPPS